MTYYIGDNYFIGINTSLGVGDALVFYGSLLAFLGTVSLGALALWQNNKLNILSKNMQKLEQAKLLSFVQLEKCEIVSDKKLTMEFYNDLTIKMTEETNDNYLAVLCTFKNASNYPISIINSVGTIFEYNDTICNEICGRQVILNTPEKEREKKGLYIEPNKVSNVVFEFPSLHPEFHKIKLFPTFTNAFGYPTTSCLLIDVIDIKIIGYNVVPFEDLNPYFKR